jgi:hypothetical protein
MTDDKVRVLRKADNYSPEQAAMVEVMRVLYDAARAGQLKELHGIAVYCEDDQIDLVAMSCGDDTASLADVVVELQDLADDIRAMRREAQIEADGEDGD